MDENENDDEIIFGFKRKNKKNKTNKTNKKKVKKKVSKQNQKKHFSKPKIVEILSDHSINDTEMNFSSDNFSNNNIPMNDSSNNYESNFINLSIDNECKNIVDNENLNKNKNENIINLENNKNKKIDNELLKLLNKKRGKEEREIEEKEKFNHHSKKEKEKQMPNFSIIKLSDNNHPKSYTFEKSTVKNILSKKEKYNKKDILIPEIEMLYNFIKQYEIEKAINSKYNPKNFPNNKFDTCLKDIREIYGDNKLIILLIKSLISLLKDNMANKNKNKEIFSIKNILNNSIILKDDENNKEGINENNPIKIIDDIDNNEINEKNINNNFEIRNDKVVSIESHYNKNKDGKLYKYEVGFLSGKCVIFHCFDRRCISYGILDLETKKFRVEKEHNLMHSEHNFIVKNEKNNYMIFKEMIEKNYLDSQVYKEGKNTIVRFYY